ncbi:MAG: porin [Gammaproteobacteria bacterium]|nr:porin [Gammaproteobacteria bacterium]
MCLVAAFAMLSALQTAIAEDEEEAKWSISGWINEGVLSWDDGVDSGLSQLSDNGTTLGSRITLAGSAKVSEGLTAGFEVILEPLSVPTPLIFSNQDGIKGNNGAEIGVLGSSAHFGGSWGKITIGLQSMPTDNIAVLADPSLTLWSGISPVFRGNGFFIRGLGAGASNEVWGSFLNCLTANGLTGIGGIGIDCNGIYRNGVRYDFPAWGNVSVAVGYANDDIYDIAAKYSGKLGRLTALLNVGYAVNSDGGAVVGATGGADSFQAQGGLMDPDTGLFGTLAIQFESADGAAAGTGNDTDAYYLKAGIKRKWLDAGDSAFYFEYATYNDQFGSGNADGITGSEVQHFGLSYDQYFGDKLIIYGKFENLSLDVDGDANAQALYGGAEDLGTFTFGVTFFF